MFSILRIIALVIIPPIGVLLKEGLGLQFILSIVLTILGYIPGLVHGIWVLTKD